MVEWLLDRCVGRTARQVDDGGWRESRLDWKRRIMEALCISVSTAAGRKLAYAEITGVRREESRGLRARSWTDIGWEGGWSSRSVTRGRFGPRAVGERTSVDVADGS